MMYIERFMYVYYTVEFQRLEQAWDHEKIFELTSVIHTSGLGDIIGICFCFYIDNGMLCVLIRIASARQF